MGKGGSTNAQINQLMHLLGGVTFGVGIFYGLWAMTRDPDTWGAADQIATYRVALLFLTSIVFFLIALNYKQPGHVGKGKDGHVGRGGGGGHHGGGGRGYSGRFGNNQNAFSDDDSVSGDE